MSEAQSTEIGLLGKLVIVVSLLLIVAGIVWYGVTLATFQRIWRNLAERPSAPMSFRSILQPSMAAIAAIHDGLALDLRAR
jgi:hypothetical protein